MSAPAARRPGWVDEILAVGVVLLIGLPLIAGRTYAFDDAQALALPLMAALQRALRAGELLAWNPDLFSGYTPIGAGQSGVFYPPNWLLLHFLPLLAAFRASYLLHFWLLARGMVGFGRRVGASTAGCLVMAAVATAGGTTAGHTMHFNIIVGMGWTAIMLWLAAWTVQSRDSWPPVLGLGAAFAMCILQAHPQYTFLAAVAVAATAPWVRSNEVSRRSAWLRLLAAAVTGTLLALAQILPLLEFARIHPRHQPGGAVQYLGTGSFTWHDWLRLVQPDLFGTPLNGTYESFDLLYWETRAFVGLVFGTLALAQVCCRPRDGASRAGLTLVALALFLLPGRSNPLYPLLVHLPPFNIFRIPGRATWLLQLGAAILAGIGVMRLERRRLPRRRIALAACLLVAVSAIAAATAQPHQVPRLAGWPNTIAWLLGLVMAVVLVAAARLGGLQRRRALAAAVVAGLVELTVSWHTFALTRPQRVFAEVPALARPILSSPNRRLLDLLPNPSGDPDLKVAMLVNNVGLLWGVPYFYGGREALQPLPVLGAYERMAGAVRDQPWRFRFDLDRYSIRWLLWNGAVKDSSLRRVGEVQGRILYENTDARPLAYALPERFVSAAGVRTHVEDDIDVRPVSVVESARERWLLETDFDDTRAVVLAQSFYPGWITLIDGQPVPAISAEGLFMALVVPPGRHQLEFRFDSASVWLGRMLSRIACCAWLLAWGWVWFRRPSPGPLTTPS